MRGTLIGKCITGLVLLVATGVIIADHMYANNYIDFPNTKLAATSEERAGLPDFVEVGELVRLNVEGEQVVWKCLPDHPDYESYGAENENLVISFRDPGVYTIIVASYLDQRVELDTYRIEVVGEAIETVTKTPVVLGELESLVIEWCKSSDMSPRVADSLAEVLQASAVENFEDTSTLLKLTAKRTRDMEVEDFMGQMTAYVMRQEEEIGKSLTVEQYKDTWNRVARGLLKYATL